MRERSRRASARWHATPANLRSPTDRPCRRRTSARSTRPRAGSKRLRSRCSGGPTSGTSPSATRTSPRRPPQLKDEFIATVSHELRTPLTAIAASLALIEDDPQRDHGRPDAGADRHRPCEQSAPPPSRRRHSRYRKARGRQGRLPSQRVAIRPVLEQAIASNRALAARQGAALRLGSARASDAYADKDRLTPGHREFPVERHQVLAAGGEVVLSADDRDGKVRLSVRDHGPGIPESFRARVFEKFAQADTSDARARSGTGLGLSIVKEIVRQMGGDVGYADAPGGGTIFFAGPAALACCGGHGRPARRRTSTRRGRGTTSRPPGRSRRIGTRYISRF